jgi:hypothetical protein
MPSNRSSKKKLAPANNAIQISAMVKVLKVGGFAGSLMVIKTLKKRFGCASSCRVLLANAMFCSLL